MISAPTKGNTKLGPDVLTESRPTHLTCPRSCPLWAACYSYRAKRYHASVQDGMRARHREWRANREEWRAERLKAWRRATEGGHPVRLLVHGDLLKPITLRDSFGFPYKPLDREWLADVIRVARQIPGFHGWLYTHAWRRIYHKHRAALERAGIRVWASVHSEEEGRLAESLGFRTALVLPVREHADRIWKDPTTGAARLICPEQHGEKKSCEECGLCWRSGRRFALLAH